MSKSVYIKSYKTEKAYSSSLDFDGSNDYISLPTAVWPGSAEGTIEMWLNMGVGVTDHIPIYFSSYANGNSTGNGFGDGGMAAHFGVDGSGNFGFWLEDNFSAVNVLGSGYPTGWNHFAVTWENGDEIKLYFNGELEATIAYNETLGNLTCNYAGIGKPAANTRYFQGKASETRIWNLARSQGEIAGNLNRKLTGNETGLVAYYKLNEGSGTTANDSAGSNDGTLTNFSGTFWLSETPPIYIQNYRGFSVDYEFDSIQTNLNAGFGSVDFTLPREFDDFGLGDTIGLDNYRLDVVAYDDEQALGQVIFTGDIAIIDTQSGRSESVTVTAIGVVERLTNTPLIVGGSYSHTYSSESVEDIFKSIILSYNNQNPQYPLKFTDSSIGTTGVTTTLTFNNANCWKALQEAFETTEQDWVFFIDSDNTVFLKQISSTPDHYLFFGKDVVSVSRTQDKTEIVNNLLVWDGDTSSPIARRYFNQDSIDTYGIRTESKRDGRFTTTAGMDDFGDAQVLRQKDPNDQVTITVLDSAGGGFDIETIQVGDVIKLLNIGTEANLSSNLVVTTKIDKLDYCELVCFDTEAFVNRELANLKENQQKVNYEDGPSSYTAVAVT